MAFTTKSWQDSPSTSTPISAAALIDLETRLSGYTDSSGGSVTLAAIAAHMPYVVDLPENHGAVRDGTTDDTTAINSAISAVVTAGQANGTNYGEVWFTAGQYAVKGSQVQGGTTKGNAQIPLPNISSTGQKFTLVLRGVTDSTPFPHWLQTTVQKSGACLVTNLSAAYSGTYGSPSCIGGPTVEQVTLTVFSNLLLVIDGLSIISPTDPHGVAVDLQGVAQANIPSLSLNASVAPGTTVPTTWANQGIGLRMPQIGNNDNCNIGVLSIEGYAYGLDIAEHTTAQRVAIIYCQYGIVFQHPMADSAWIGYLSTEACNYHISSSLTSATGTNRCPITISQWDIEDSTTTYHLDDSGNFLEGTVTYLRWNGSVTGTSLLVNGATNLKRINIYNGPGHATPPSVPGSTTPLLNPFDRDAAVTISGGTVTVIAVDGTATGITATGHTVIVPSGKTITLTYSVAPSWNWVLL